MGSEALFKLFQLLKNHFDMKRGTWLKGVIPGNPPDPFHFIIMRFVFYGELVNGVFFKLVVYPGRIAFSFQRAFKKSDISEQGVLFLINVMDKILHEKREHQLEILFEISIVSMIRPERLNQAGDVGELMLYEKKVSVFQVLDDQVDGVASQGQLGFFQVGRRLQLPYDLINFQAAFLADLFEGVLGAFVEFYAEVVKDVPVDVVLVHQLADPLIL